MFEPEIKKIIQSRLSEGTPFAVFRLPGSRSVHIDGSDGYSLLINNYDRPYCNAKSVSEYVDTTKIADVDISESENRYLSNVEHLINKLSGKSDEKTVLSRIITGNTDPASIITATELLFDANPESFCMMLRILPAQVYLMATPELLLETKNGFFRTMALAGTRGAQEGSTPWDAKNIAEQQVVASYIENILTSLQLEFTSLGPTTIKSANVEHLCTVFEGKLRTDVSLESLVDALSPTPAVCGFPVDEAKANINRLEEYKRGFYTGYTVVKSNDGTVKIFVNLRCATIDVHTGRYAVFVGGGITSASDKHAELNETNLKAKPLAKILQKPETTLYTD